MADTEDWFADVQAVLDADAVDAPEEPSAPELDSAPPTAESIPAEEVPAEPVTEPVVEATAPVVEQTPAQPNWDSPDNPHYAAAQRLAQMEAIQRAFQQRKAE